MTRFARLARLKMFMPTSLLRTIVLLLGIATLVFLGGCRKPTTSFFQEEEKPAMHSSDSTPGADDSTPKVNENQRAIEVVTDYLTALKKDQFDVAYNMLSRDSQKLQSLSEFEQLGKQGMPSFDLKSASVTRDGDAAQVTLQQVEDQAAHEFHLVREDDAWKIVYRGGVPGMPYAEQPSVGQQKGDTHESYSE